LKGGIKMHIRTIEDDFEYQMERIITDFKKRFELEGLDAEELQDKIWKDHAEEFGRAVLERCVEYSGDELFE
jgi:hypothetical protein